MIEIKLYNRRTCEVLVRKFEDEGEADLYEATLEFLGAEYEFWLNGERLY